MSESPVQLLVIRCYHMLLSLYLLNLLPDPSTRQQHCDDTITNSADHQKAREDAEERKLLAADRLAQRYKQLEEEKSAKRIVYVDKMTVPAKGKAARGRSGGMIFARGGRGR